ncbi:MAG: class I SAM-dependent methyltransferase [Streptosporangiaceae bacterium]|jgi:ubiquinone/menaquinone biosynthesis C-methylase UbiE
MTTTTASYEANPARGPFNAAFFTVMGSYLDWLMRSRKKRVFANLPDEIVELGPGVGANFRYLRPGIRVIAVEPNPAMHARLRARAASHEIGLELHDVVGEQLDLPDASTDMVLSSLVLCTVSDPAQVLAEIRRVLRPGGRYAFVEHVGAKDRLVLRRIQRLVRRPWAWVFEGCSCERDLAEVVASAGFASVEVEEYRVHSPVLPFNTHVAGIATKGAEQTVSWRPGAGQMG